MAVTPPDIIICLILGFFTFNGFLHGFIEEMSKIISLICGFIFAAKFHNLLIPYLTPYIKDESICITVAYFCLLIISVLIITIIATMFQKFIELVLLGWLNKLLGAFLGLIKGMMIVSLMLFIILAIPFKFEKGETIRKKMEQESVMFRICMNIKEFIIITIPMNQKIDFFHDFKKKMSDEEKLDDFLQIP